MPEFMEMGLLGILFVGSFSLVPLALLSLAVPYVVIRRRDETADDPQLGAKVAFQFFFSAGLLALLSGLTILIVDAVTRGSAGEMGAFGGGSPFGEGSEWLNAAQRLGTAILLSGIASAVLGSVCVARTTVANRGRVRRMFVGWRLAILGAVTLVALTMLFTLVLQRSTFQPSLSSTFKAVLAVFVLWGGTFTFHLGQMFAAIQRPTTSDVASGPAAKTA